jgi:hypothetical protein
MFRTIFYGALLGSLVFAASETLAHASKTPAQTPKKFRIKHDVTKGVTAPELGFVSDILDMKDWKKLRRESEPSASFSTLMDQETGVTQTSSKKSDGGS